MKIKYKEAGLEFKCFHNRGHPERWSPKALQISMLQSGQMKVRNEWEYT
jgi:hypothetical protein